MRKLLFALLVSAFAMSFGAGAALAGGASDSSGDGKHCYLFFVDLNDTDWTAQAMMNGDDDDDGDKPSDVAKKACEFIQKYVYDEGFNLEMTAGNLGLYEVQNAGCSSASRHICHGLHQDR